MRIGIKVKMIINSLPFQRKEIVIAKYIFVSILVTLGEFSHLWLV